MTMRIGTVGLLLVLLLSACEFGSSPSDDTGSSPGGSDATSPATSAAPASVTVSPQSGTKAVRPDRPVEVTVANGSLEKVTVTQVGADDVAGALSQDDTHWRSSAPLEPDARYVVHATAIDRQDQRSRTRSTFRTLKPKEALTTAVAPLDGETVGVGMPIQVQLSAAPPDRAAVEKALTVQTRPSVKGSWHWVSDRALRYRPKSFWSPGTRVTLHVGLTGVDAGNRVWGDESREVTFRIGAAMVSRVNDATQKMRVRRNGKHVRTIGISDGNNGFRTRSGTKVIMLKHRTYDMNSSTIGIDPGSAQGYDLADVPFAMRLTNSGEFLHAAPWNTANFGRVRSSHGCIGMSKADARWLFKHSRRGDVVRVVHSPAAPPKVSNGYGGWNLSWSQWKAGSAL